MFRLKIGAAASRNIEEQAAYYREVAVSDLEIRWRLAVNEAIRSLRTMPERGALGRFTRPSLHGLRWLPIQGFPRHLIFYRVDTESRVVVITNILHGARDLERELWLSDPPQTDPGS